MVIKTKSVKYMPFWLSLVAFLNGVCWTSYALLKFDIFITVTQCFPAYISNSSYFFYFSYHHPDEVTVEQIPNGLGAIFGFLQLLLYACYCRCTPAVELENEEAKKRQDIEMA